jgi:hypothetical protein
MYRDAGFRVIFALTVAIVGSNISALSSFASRIRGGRGKVDGLSALSVAAPDEGSSNLIGV